MELSNGVLLRPDQGLLGAHPFLYGEEPVVQARRLADALVCGPLWAELSPRFGLAVRTDGEPVIAVLGTAQVGDAARLGALGWQVTDTLARLRPVSFGEAEALCVQLAARLREHLGATLDGARVEGIPRGGLVVAGLLACALGVSATRVGSWGNDGVVVVVDDCSLSGARLRRWLRDRSHTRVVVALLHASPGLRAAVEADERVDACFAAGDLRDHALQQRGARHEEWVHRWRERSPDDYWTGQPDHVVYPWNEPDTALWNDETGTAEPGWRVVPPDRCLKNHGEAPPAGRGVQVCMVGNGPIRPAEGVVWADAQGSMYVAEPTSGRVMRMAGVAAGCWTALMATGDPEAAAAAVAADYAQPLQRVRADLDRFIAECRHHGLVG